MKVAKFILFSLLADCKVRSSQNASKEFSKNSDPVNFFSDSSPLNVNIQSNFEKVFERRKKNNGRLEAVNQKVPGVFTLTRANGTQSKATVAITPFGNTSLTQCSYPKIKVEFQDHSAIPELGDTNILMLATHCAPTDASLGRQMGDAYVVREWLTYELGRALELPVPRSRLLNITYQSTGGKFQQTETHPAFALEHFSVYAKRHNSIINTPKVISPPNEMHKLVSEMDPIVLAKGHLFQAFIGNNDWIFYGIKPVFPVSFWNIEILEDITTKKPQPLFFDFDLARIVTKFTPENQPPLKTMSRITWNDSFFPDLKGNVARTHLEVQFVRSKHNAKAMEAARSFYLGKKSELTKVVENFKSYKIINESELDVVEEFIQNFYTSLEDKRFLVPIIGTKPGILNSSGASTQSCSNLPAGLPVQPITSPDSGASTAETSLWVNLPFKPKIPGQWGCAVNSLQSDWKAKVLKSQLVNAEAGGNNPASGNSFSEESKPIELNCNPNSARMPSENPNEEMNTLEDLGCS